MSFQAPDILGGLLFSGYKGENRFEGNGDCVLLDGMNGILGIADGSERSPQASRAFLERLADRMEKNREKSGEEGFDPLMETAQQVLDTFHYEDRTTFLCLHLHEDGTAVYISGGDSLLFHVNPEDSRVLFRNRSNMGFAGRSKHIIDSGLLQAKQGDLFLLATDGVWDLLNGKSENLIRSFFEMLKTTPFPALPERLVKQKHPAFQEGTDQQYDDLCVLLVDPFRFSGFRSRVLMGGTGRREEKHYQALRTQNTFPDRSVRLPENGLPLWIFPDQFGQVR